MNILFDIGHPGHVHLLKNLILHFRKSHSVWVTVKDLPVAKSLLIKYGISFLEIGTKRDHIVGKAFSQIKYNLALYKLVKEKNIHLGIGSSITLAHVSCFTKMRSIILDDDDDEVQPLFVKFAHPFCDTLLSPECLEGKRKKKKTVYYSGFHELAYLHPNYFKADPGVLDELGLKEGDPFFIMRFNSFKAHHDVGVRGLSLEQKLQLVELLKKHGKVFVTTERSIEEELKSYQLLIPAEKIHSLMYYATMFLGDSQTMTSEAAVLGTPAIRCNNLVGRISYLEEEEHKYGLTFGFHPNHFKSLLSKVELLLQDKDLKDKWQVKRERLLAEKIDVAAFLIWFIENYPDSEIRMNQSPNFQFNFR